MGESYFATFKLKCPNTALFNYTDLFADMKEFAKTTPTHIIALPSQELDNYLKKFPRNRNDAGEDIVEFEYNKRKIIFTICDDKRMATYKKTKAYEEELAKYSFIFIIAFHHRLMGAQRFPAWEAAIGGKFLTFTPNKLKKCNDIYLSVYDRNTRQ